MEYFVSVENHPYYCWQLELLIQSFKENCCENDLAVILSQSNAPQNIGKNLLEHKRLYGYQNIGDVRGYKPLNQIYTLFWALQAKQISQPFVWMQPDMVLRSPLDISFSNYPEFVFYPDPFFTLKKAEKEIGPFQDWLQKNYVLNWIPIGSLVACHQIPPEFFELVAKRTELLVVKQLMNNQRVSNKTMNVALATILSDHVENIFCRGDYSLVSAAMDGTNSPIISYEHGIPPDFHKSMFAYPPPAYVSFGDPIKILSETFPTPNAHYISMLAGKNLHSRNKGLE